MSNQDGCVETTKSVKPTMTDQNEGAAGSRSRHRTILAAVLVLFPGCSSSPATPDADLGRIDAAVDVVHDQSPPREVSADLGPCTKPTAGMEISSDTTLCGGEYLLGDSTRKGVVRIVAPKVTLTCRGTVLRGNKLFGAKDPPELGIVIDKQDDVTVTGCALHGYRVAVLATSLKNLKLTGNDLSDNFSDEKAEWVFDTVQGGGVQLQSVTDSTVESNIIARNWSGLDLRDCRRLAVRKNTIDHCTNTAALVLSTHDSTFEDNDMSWGVRGGLSFPGNWWKVDTKDSAGMLLDAGSSGNKILRNNLTYGGDGLFLRAVIGQCPHHNHVEGNDTSFSPHNAIESWCDDNTYLNNQANDSDYGFWLGGSDRTIVRGNQVNNNKTDGMSIQIGESRTMIIEDNTIKGNGRVGILATGREYQSWDPLTKWGTKLANASQYVIQKNTFASNGKWDLFLTSIRGVLLAANTYGGTNTVSIGKEALDVRTVSTGPTTTQVPSAVVSPASVALPGSITLDASGSTDPGGKALTYYWLVQEARTSFGSGSMPTPLLAGEGTATPQITPTSPGVFDVFLIVDNKALGALAATSLYVTPSGTDRAEGNATSWSYECASSPTCKTTISDDAAVKVAGSSSIHVQTDAPYEFRLKHSAPTGSPYDLSAAKAVGLFLQAKNPNASWQMPGPWLVLRSKSGSVTYKPTSDWLAAAQNAWIYLEVPLGAGASTEWTRTDAGMDLAAATSLELVMDTYGWNAYDVWVDGLTWY
jgi:parallel beta-helix repeat protein